VSADVVALRLAGPGDTERLWIAYRDAADALEAEVASGIWKIETAARCVDAYRAWCRAYCGVAFP